METKTIKLDAIKGSIDLENVIPLPCVWSHDEWVYVEFPYKHLLPILEVA
jgi:hypothetical protein